MDGQKKKKWDVKGGLKFLKLETKITNWVRARPTGVVSAEKKDK